MFFSGGGGIMTVNGKQFEEIRRRSSRCDFRSPPHGRATLLASPRFKPDGSSNWFLGVGGETKDGRKCELAMELKKRASSAEGPLKFNIMIEPKDLT